MRKVVTLLLIAIIIGCGSSPPPIDNSVRHSKIPAHVIEAYSPETKVVMRYYLTRTYMMKEDTEEMLATELVTPSDEIILPPDTEEFIFTANFENPERVYIDVWRHLETKKFNTLTLYEFDLNKKVVYHGKMPTRSYQLRLPLEENFKYRFYVEMKKGGANDLIFKTIAFRYWKQL